MPFWGVVMGVVNIIMGVARGRYHQLPVGVAMVPEGSLKKLEPMQMVDGKAQARTARVAHVQHSRFHSFLTFLQLSVHVKQND